MIKEPNWKYSETVEKPIQVLDVDEEEREVDALDLRAGMPFILDASEEINLAEIEKGKAYKATFKVYRGAITPELKKQWDKMKKENASLRKGIETVEAKGSSMPLFKFELVALEPL